MNAELEQEILAAHPDLYRNLKSRFPDQQHFECGDGWGKILKELSTRLDPYAATDDLVIIQVKEKLGSLRVYVRFEGHDWSEKEEVVEVVRRWRNVAEEQSCYTCEVCGAAGRVRKSVGGGVRAFCEACAVAHRRNE